MQIRILRVYSFSQTIPRLGNSCLKVGQPATPHFGGIRAGETAGARDEKLRGRGRGDRPATSLGSPGCAIFGGGRSEGFRSKDTGARDFYRVLSLVVYLCMLPARVPFHVWAPPENLIK